MIAFARDQQIYRRRWAGQFLATHVLILDLVKHEVKPCGQAAGEFALPETPQAAYSGLRCWYAVCPRRILRRQLQVQAKQKRHPRRVVFFARVAVGRVHGLVEAGVGFQQVGGQVAGGV